MLLDPKEADLSISKVAKDHHIGIGAVRRWILVGRRNTATGERVRLAAVVVGGSWRTTAAAVEAFHGAVNRDRIPGPPAANAVRTPAERAAAHEAALAQCRAMGLKV